MEKNLEDNKIEKFKRRYDKILKKKETSEGNKKWKEILLKKMNL